MLELPCFRRKGACMNNSASLLAMYEGAVPMCSGTLAFMTDEAGKALCIDRSVLRSAAIGEVV